MTDVTSLNKAFKPLVERKQWVVYVLPSKAPRNATGLAKTNNSRTWMDFEFASNLVQQGKAHGVGYVLQAHDDLTVIDLDNVLDDKGKIKDTQIKNIVDQCDSYIEISPSGRGLHLWIKGAQQENSTTLDIDGTDMNVEIYSHKRYITITNKTYKDSPILAAPEVVEKMLAFSKKNNDKVVAGINKIEIKDNLSSEEVLGYLSKLNPKDQPNGDYGYDKWLKVGMALHDWDEDVGLEYWDSWSHLGTSYDGSCNLKWKSFAVQPEGIGIGTLIQMAGGYRENSSDKKPIKAKCYSFLEFVNMDFPPREWLIPNLMGKGDLVLIHGAPGHAKSLAVQSLAVSLASGRNFGNYAVSSPEKCLIVDAELPPTEIQTRIQQMNGHGTQSEQFKMNSNLFITSTLLHTEPLPPLNTKPGKQWYMNLIEDKKPSLVILDNLLTLCSFEDNNRGEQFMDQVAPILLEMVTDGYY